MEKNLGAKINYEDFLAELDKRLASYFNGFGDEIYCKRGCSDCCEKGDYPLTDIELSYLMQGFAELDSDTKLQIQNNIKNMKKGEKCPFLINKECSVYNHRPIICRVHGLAYYYKDKKVKLPYCVNNGKNFPNSFKDGEFWGKPIPLNLDTPHILEGIYSEMKNMYEWFAEK